MRTWKWLQTSVLYAVICIYFLTHYVPNPSKRQSPSVESASSVSGSSVRGASLTCCNLLPEQKMSFVRAKNHDRTLFFFPAAWHTLGSLISSAGAGDHLKGGCTPAWIGKLPIWWRRACQLRSKQQKTGSLSLSFSFAPSLHSLSLFLSPFFPSLCAFFFSFLFAREPR